MKPLWIFGSGGHAKVIIDAARLSGRYKVLGALDDDPVRLGTRVLGVMVRGLLSPEALERFEVRHAVIAIGSNRSRAAVAERFARQVRWETIAHPRACIGSAVDLGEGTVVLPGTVIEPACRIGRHAILNTSCSIDHDNVVEDYVHVAPGAHLGGHVTLREGCMVGMGATVINGLTVGAWAMVGAGAVAVRDVADGATVVGVPAKPVGHGQRATTIPAYAVS